MFAYSVPLVLVQALVLFNLQFAGSALARNQINKESPWTLSGLERSRISQREFDYFVFALEWPGTICRSNRHCCSSNACCQGGLNPLHFTIHGLWPDYSDGSWPQCCNGPRYDEKKIASLHEDLEKYWPSLYCSHPRDCHGKRGTFWGHEWEKHGTCSYPVIKDEYDYFSTAMQLLSKYSVLDMLAANAFTPNNNTSYSTQDIIAAINKGFGGTPLLICSHDSIKEIRICFDKTFKPRDCTGHSSCPSHIFLPSYELPGGSHQESLAFVSRLLKNSGVQRSYTCRNKIVIMD